MTKIDAFTRIFQLPIPMQPYLNLIVTEQEIDLIVGLEDEPLSIAEIAERLRISQEETTHLVRGAYKRDIIKQIIRGGQKKYAPGHFYANLDFFSAYETGTWRRLPEDIRNEIGEWQILEFIEMWKPAIEEVAINPDAWVQIKNRDVLLLEQALEMVEASEYLCLLPCQCKTTLCTDSPLIEGSMRLGKRARETLDKGQGRSLTVEQAKAHLINLDRMGLIHTGPRQWRKYDPKLEWVSHGNCHPSYSFPFIAGQRLGLEKRYPRAYYTAVVDWDKCTHCGVCLGRCPFGAFYQDGTEARLHGESFRKVSYDDDLCWGCGLCANACSDLAIEMKPLN
jgi:NAD-dependent dihydropyrimidine dehydrogenase PreA subunit/DNA-binding transcriptional regulator GbsR (MarR family)